MEFWKDAQAQFSKFYMDYLCESLSCPICYCFHHSFLHRMLDFKISTIFVSARDALLIVSSSCLGCRMHFGQLASTLLYGSVVPFNQILTASLQRTMFQRKQPHSKLKPYPRDDTVYKPAFKKLFYKVPSWEKNHLIPQRLLALNLTDIGRSKHALGCACKACPAAISYNEVEEFLSNFWENTCPPHLRITRDMCLPASDVPKVVSELMLYCSQPCCNHLHPFSVPDYMEHWVSPPPPLLHIPFEEQIKEISGLTPLTSSPTPLVPISSSNPDAPQIPPLDSQHMDLGTPLSSSPLNLEGIAPADDETFQDFLDNLL